MILDNILTSSLTVATFVRLQQQQPVHSTSQHHQPEDFTWYDFRIVFIFSPVINIIISTTGIS